MLSNHDERVKNRLRSTVLDCQTRGFKVVSAFLDQAFEPLVDWARQDLHLDLTTYTADSHVPQAENIIRFVKERL